MPKENSQLLTAIGVMSGTSMDAIDAEPVLKKHEATLKKICDDFAATGSY